jgi:serine/threonine protein kinase
MTPTLLNNRYQVIQTLGAGGFGTTYLAEDTQMPSHRKCVIKQLKPIANNPDVYQLVQERFQREAAILEELGDVNAQIPRLYAYFAEAGEFYLIQEWIEGMTLRDRVQTGGTQPEAIVREILIHLLPVLSYVHDKRIVHRDIKPDNIILRKRDGKPVLIDFGAVRETMGTVVNSQGGSASSIVIGTPGFMPSEQAAGRPLYSSDLYSLGLTMIYLLTARFPQELDLDPQTGEVIWRKYAPQVSPEFASVLEKTIQYHPRDRYATAQDMLAALQNLVTVSPTLPVVDPTVQAIDPTLVPPTQQPHAISGAVSPHDVPPTVFTPQTIQQPLKQPDQVNDKNAKDVPDEILGWNWGAFLLPGFWSLGNQVWLGLLCSWVGLFAYGLGWFVVGGILGAKGNEWAWKSRRWRSVEAFKSTQRAWAIGGALTWGSLIGLLVVAGIYGSQIEDPTPDPLTGSVSTPSNGDTPTITLFGATEPLSEPTAYLDGTWKLSYSLGTINHQGTLLMQGKAGTLTMQTADSSNGQVKTVSQTMRLWASPRGLVVLGYNPVNPSTQAAEPDYAADNFLFQQQSDGSMKVTNCDDQGNCSDVAARFSGTP